MEEGRGSSERLRFQDMPGRIESDSASWLHWWAMPHGTVRYNLATGTIRPKAHYPCMQLIANALAQPVADVHWHS